MKRFIFTPALALAALCCIEPVAAEDEYRVEPVAELAAEGLSPEIAAQISPTGVKLVKGENRSILTFWPVKELAVNEAFKPSASLLYPLEMGQLVGVVYYKRAAEDFRGQEIVEGTYTVRFALQPEDGNHVGTSDTRDFLVLLKAADDKTPAAMPKESLFKLSAAAAGTTHPCMWALLSAEGAGAELPKVEHDADRELWSIEFAAKTAKGMLAIKPVVVGQAAE